MHRYASVSDGQDDILLRDSLEGVYMRQHVYVNHVLR